MLFPLTKLPWLRELILKTKWIARNFHAVVLSTRCIYCLFAWVNMQLGLVCMGLWKPFEKKANVSYYIEPVVGYGQVLSPFLWTPVFTMFVQISAKQYAECKWSPGHYPLSTLCNLQQLLSPKGTPSFQVFPVGTAVSSFRLQGPGIASPVFEIFFRFGVASKKHRLMKSTYEIKHEQELKRLLP